MRWLEWFKSESVDFGTEKPEPFDRSVFDVSVPRLAPIRDTGLQLYLELAGMCDRNAEVGEIQWDSNS